MNGERQEGFGLMDTTIFNGKRQSTSVTYLHPIKHRSNLEILTNVTVNKILFENKKLLGLNVKRMVKIKSIFQAKRFFFLLEL